MKPRADPTSWRWTFELRARLPYVDRVDYCERQIVASATGGLLTKLAESGNSTLASTYLLATGQSGAFRALGPAGNLAAQVWNAAMSAIGTAQHVKAGNANKGKRYPVPKGHAADR